jgi:DNA-binding CsgD family transcriptional regulator
MADLELDVLTRLLDELLTDQKQKLTPAECTEVLCISRGFACKDSAANANISPETIRARRKRIYRKLGLEGASDVISSLLALALRELAMRQREGAGATGQDRRTNATPAETAPGR